MAFELDALVSKAHGERREGVWGWFVTPTPWVGSAAYFHVVFKPAPTDALRDVAERWRFPNALVDLLSRNNGAILFCGSISVYGVHLAGQLLNRTDPYARLPFNIEWENDTWRYERERLLVIGAYRQDGSVACIDRTTSGVIIFPRGGDEPIAAFDNLGHWLTSEIARYRNLYDEQGRLFGTAEETGPPRPLDRKKVN